LTRGATLIITKVTVSALPAACVKALILNTARLTHIVGETNTSIQEETFRTS